MAKDGGAWLKIHVPTAQTATKWLDQMETGKTYTCTLAEKRKKRSLDANAYYHVLVRELAHVLGITENACHNLMLRRYGAIEEVSGERPIVFIPDTEEAENTALEEERFHIKPTSQTKTGKNGCVYRAYYFLKGSHDYETKEMHYLISGVVDECKSCGIETKTQEEIDSLVRRWNQTGNPVDTYGNSSNEKTNPKD